MREAFERMPDDAAKAQRFMERNLEKIAGAFEKTQNRFVGGLFGERVSGLALQLEAGRINQGEFDSQFGAIESNMMQLQNSWEQITRTMGAEFKKFLTRMPQGQAP